MPSETLHNHVFDFNIDQYINPYLPHNYLYLLPRPINHFLGCRPRPHVEPPALLQWLVTASATLAGISLVGGVYNYGPALQQYQPPTMIASLGASAILDYSAIRSPLAQPRNAVLGHTLAAVIGVSVTKGFEIHQPDFFANYDWVVAAIACAAASLAMSLTGTVHPPGGATAVLAATNKEIIAMGWMFPVFILMASVLMLIVACLFNNTFRQYPVFWWSAEHVGQAYKPRSEGGAFMEHEKKASDGFSMTGQDLEKLDSNTETLTGSDRKKSGSEMEGSDVFKLRGETIHITPYAMVAPPDLDLGELEKRVLEGLMEKLRRHEEMSQARMS